MPHVKSGQLNGLAVTTARRSPSAMELATVSEAGIAGCEATFGDLFRKSFCSRGRDGQRDTPKLTLTAGSLWPLADVPFFGIGDTRSTVDSRPSISGTGSVVEWIST